MPRTAMSSEDDPRALQMRSLQALADVGSEKRQGPLKRPPMCAPSARRASNAWSARGREALVPRARDARIRRAADAP
jgi:hypothetical protein